MKIPTRFHLLGAILLALGLSPSTAGQGFAIAGPEHELLKRLEGTWTATVKMQEMTSTGTLTYTMACNGLWLLSEFRGNFGGFEFEGRGFDGYDPIKQKYISIWVDSASTRPMQTEGTYNAETKTLTMMGEGRGPDGNPVQQKMVTHMPDKDRKTFKIFLLGADGEETPFMTIEYERKK